jgi:hypothetical protein
LGSAACVAAVADGSVMGEDGGGAVGFDIAVNGLR